MAALAGPILAAGGFLWVNMVALGVFVPMMLLGLRSYLRRSADTDSTAPQLVS